MERTPIPAVVTCALLCLTGLPAAAQIQRVLITPQIVRLRPLTEDQTRILTGIKTWSAGYLESLPDYICIQTTKRHAQAAQIDSWPMSDEVREAVTWSGHKESYEVLSVNGKPFHGDRTSLRGNFSTGEFGTILQRLFDADSTAEFGYERRTTLRGVPVDVFDYQVSNAHGYTLYSGPQKYESAWEGLVYADRRTGAVLRIAMECTGIPANFPVHHLSMTLDFGPARVGDREYLLPAHFELTQESSGGYTNNRADYGSYRKFETDASFRPDGP
jgi:hypothetical protein